MFVTNNWGLTANRSPSVIVFKCLQANILAVRTHHFETLPGMKD